MTRKYQQVIKHGKNVYWLLFQTGEYLLTNEEHQMVSFAEPVLVTEGGLKVRIYGKQKK